MVDEIERLRLQRILSDWSRGFRSTRSRTCKRARREPRRRLPPARAFRRRREPLRMGALRPDPALRDGEPAGGRRGLPARARLPLHPSTARTASSSSSTSPAGRGNRAGPRSRGRPRACARGDAAAGPARSAAPSSSSCTCTQRGARARRPARAALAQRHARAARGGAPRGRARDGERKSSSSCQAVLSGRKLHACSSPSSSVKDGRVLGYEALIRGSAGRARDAGRPLRGRARGGHDPRAREPLRRDVLVRCRARAGKQLFVNASSRLLTHSVFLDDRNLAR